MTIQYIDRYSGDYKQESIYFEGMMKFLFTTAPGQILFEHFLGKRPFSQFYGSSKDSTRSAAEIPEFIETHDINMSEFVDENYTTFNDFFIRKFKEGARSFGSNPKHLSAPCEGRYLGIQEMTPETKVPVKGRFLNPVGLLGNVGLGEQFMGAPMLISRLAPIDYHRFHFPCEGEILDKYDISGDLFSVNPLCLKWKEDTFLRNYRRIHLFDTPHFGKLPTFKWVPFVLEKLNKLGKRRPLVKAMNSVIFFLVAVRSLCLGSLENGRLMKIFF